MAYLFEFRQTPIWPRPKTGRVYPKSDRYNRPFPRSRRQSAVPLGKGSLKPLYGFRNLAGCRGIARYGTGTVCWKNKPPLDITAPLLVNMVIFSRKFALVCECIERGGGKVCEGDKGVLGKWNIIIPMSPRGLELCCWL